jgi:hypothetical protein
MPDDGDVNPWLGRLARDGYRVSPPKAPDALTAAQAESGRNWPRDLVLLYQACDGVFDTLSEMWVIWPLGKLPEQNRWLRESFYDFPYDLIAFGDNGCGEPFCTNEKSPSVVCWYPIEGEARIVASDLNDFWQGWASGTLKS